MSLRIRPNGRSAAMPAVPAALNSREANRLHRYVGSETARWSKIVQQAGATGIE